MGHMDGSVPPRYTYITRLMRDGLMAGLTAEWEGALDAWLAPEHAPHVPGAKSTNALQHPPSTHHSP